jgi:nicotinamidase-related amidase
MMRSQPESTVLAVIDIQERLARVVPGCEAIVERAVRLARAAELLGVRRELTEQYPKGLGPTVPSVAACMPAAEEKLAFSAAGCGCLAVEPGRGVESVVLAGLETHVCILQTALDLLARGLVVFVPVDAVASRFAIDHETALRRLEHSGAILTTSESLLFEWCRRADHEQFREIRSLITGA